MAPLDLQGLMAALSDAYRADGRLQHHAAEELPAIQTTLSLLLPDLAQRFDVVGALKPGGGGVPILLSDRHLGNQRCVLKMPRPVLGREAQLNKILLGEAERLSAIRHHNVIRVLLTGTVDATEVPYYIMECVPDPSDADDFLRSHPTVEALIKIVEGAVGALEHIHSLNIVHTDVKPANLFVDASGATLLADFGFAKRLDAADPLTTVIGGTGGYMHPEQCSLMAELNAPLDQSDVQRQATPIDFPIDRDRIKSYWDLYSLGITLFVLLRVVEHQSPRLGKEYPMRYLRLMAYRLVGQNLEFARNNVRDYPGLDIADTIFGLESRDTKELQYADMSEVLADFQKLVGARDLIRDVPELGRHQGEMIQAASHGPVPFTERVRTIVHSHEVRHLGSLTQLALVKYVYPTASHSRLEHTLGTFSMACRYVRALYNDPVNPIFKQIMRVVDIEALLVGSLVHDVGHYPLAHDLEDVEPRVFSHAARTQYLLTDATKSVLASLLNENTSGWSVDVNRVISLLKAGTDPERSSFRDSVLSAVIDGPIDADKLDYLIRDSENLRVPYGRGIDVDRLISSATVVMIPRQSGRYEVNRFPSLGIHDRGRIAAESLAFARYAMYGSVYWHRTHRTLKAMLSRITAEAMWNSRFKGLGKVRDRWIEKTRSRLYTFLDSPLQQQLLPPSDAARFNGPASESGFIDSASDDMLDWLVSLAGEGASSLAADIRGRRLFDRVLVTSEYREPDLPWHLVRRVLGKRGASDGLVWERQLKFARRLQEEVLKAVGAWDRRTEPGASIVSPDKIELLLAEGSRRPLVLVDYPSAKTGSAHALSYLYEREWHDPETDPFEAVAADQSPIWKALGNEMQTSLAKLRVYCDPAFSSVVTAAVPRAALERHVAVCLDEIDEAD